MPPARDDETGKYNQEYPIESFFEALEEIEVATTSRVAERVGCSYDLAYRRLNELEKKGSIAKQDAGGSFIWKSSPSEDG